METFVLRRGVKRPYWLGFINVLDLPSFLPHMLFLLLIWWLAPHWIYILDATAAIPDGGIILLILIAILVFLVQLWLSGYLLKRLLAKWGLPSFPFMVSQFKELVLWQQYVFYWASFALLLLGAIGCLIAIC